MGIGGKLKRIVAGAVRSSLNQKNSLRRATLGVATGAALVVPGMIAAPVAMAAEAPAPAPTQGSTTTVPVTKAATTAGPTPAPKPTVAPKPGVAGAPQTAPAPHLAAPPAAQAPKNPALVAAGAALVKAAALHSLSSTVSDRTVTVSGFGFEPNETLTLRLDRSDGLSIPATVQATVAGTVSLTITATGAASGTYTLTATGTTSAAASTSFTLAKVYTYAPAATATPTVKVGQPITVDGTGWTKGTVAVSQSGSAKADIVTPIVDGSFSTTVSPQAVGAVVVTVTDGITTKTVTATAETYTPAVSPAVSAVAEHDQLIIKGAGFVPNSTVKFDLTPWPAFTYGPGSEVTSDANGNISIWFSVPNKSDLPAGTVVTITAIGDYNTTASTSVTIIDNVHPNAKLDAVAAVEQGQAIVVNGEGFRPNARVSVGIDWVAGTDIWTGSDGSFTVSMPTDYNTHVGDVQVRVTAGSTLLTATTTITEHIFHPAFSAPSQVEQGTTFTVTGTGYKPSERVVINAGDIAVTPTYVNGDGGFSYSFKLGRNFPPGNRTITATSEDGKRMSSTSVTVVKRTWPTISASQMVTAGGSVKISGTGFDPYGFIWMTIPGVGFFTTLAEADGTFGMHYGEVAYRVNTPGTYTISAEDNNGDVRQATFTVVPAVPVTPLDPPVNPPVSPEPVTPAPPVAVESVAVMTPNPLAFISQDAVPRPAAASSVVAPFDVPNIPGQNSAAAQADPTPLVTPKAGPAAVPDDISKVSDDINWIPYVFGGILVLVAAGGGVLVAARGRRAGDSG